MARVRELTEGVGVDAVLECVGTREAMHQAIGCARQGGYIGYVGVPHGVELDGQDLFFNGQIKPGKVFDLTLPLDRVAEGDRAMDERRAIKVLLLPNE